MIEIVVFEDCRDTGTDVFLSMVIQETAMERDATTLDFEPAKSLEGKGGSTRQ